VYAAKLDRELERTGREERIRHAPGDASDLTLSVRGDAAWLAWSDPREAAKEGLGDIYVATLRARDAKRDGDETRVLATAAHSRSPVLAPTPDGLTLAWIEDAPMGVEARGAGVATAMVAHLDAEGRVATSPQRLPLAAEGTPTSVALDPVAGGIHAVVVRATREGLAADGFTLTNEGLAPAKAWSLVDLDGPPSLDVPVEILGDVLVVADAGAAQGERRVRRATLAWRR
jgi:hypothetical protein